jgi:hypothetical protein
LNPDYADRLAWPATDEPARQPQEIAAFYKVVEDQLVSLY